jgi:hypothetical protein
MSSVEENELQNKKYSDVKISCNTATFSTLQLPVFSGIRIFSVPEQIETETKVLIP